MTNEFIKAILKENFNYDEDAAFSTRTHAIYAGAKYLKDKMDRDGLLADLVIFGANNAFPRKLQKRIEQVIELYLRLPGNNDLSSPTAKAAVRIEREFMKLSEKSKDMRLASTDTLGVRPYLTKRLHKAEGQIRKLLDTGLATYGCEELAPKFEEALQKLGELKSTLALIPDVCSEGAVKSASRVAEILDGWLGTTVISIIENGEIPKGSSLTSALSKIAKALSEWGCRVDSTVARSFALGETGSPDLELLLAEPTSDDVRERRSELRALKEQNDHTLSEIKDLLSELPGELQRDPRYTAVTAAFSSHSLLTKKPVVGVGNDYFEDRIRTERDLADFARSTLELLKLQKTEVTLRALHARTKRWLEIKSSEWRNDIMNESKLKKDLNEELAKTRRDFETLHRYAGLLKNKSLQSIARSIIETVDKNLAALESSSVANNADNAKVAERIVRKTFELREKAFSFSASFECGELSSELDGLFASLLGSKNSSNETRREFPLPSTPDEGKSYANIATGKADVLTSALFVLRTECKNEEFFKSLERAMEQEELKATGGAKKRIDEIDKRMAFLVKDNAEKIAKAQATADKTEKLGLLRAAKDGQDELNALTNEKAKLKSVVASYKTPESYVLMQKMLNEVARLFSNDIAAPYEVRAKIMAQNGLYDLEKLYNDFRVLAFGHEKDFEIKLMMLTKTINKVLEQFDIEKPLDGFMIEKTAQTVKEPEAPEKTYEQSKKEEEDELAALEAMFGLSDTTSEAPTPETEQKSGDVATVNTKDSAIDSLRNIVDDFGDGV